MCFLWMGEVDPDNIRASGDRPFILSVNAVDRIGVL